MHRLCAARGVPELAVPTVQSRPRRARGARLTEMARLPRRKVMPRKQVRVRKGRVGSSRWGARLSTLARLPRQKVMTPCSRATRLKQSTTPARLGLGSALA